MLLNVDDVFIRLNIYAFPSSLCVGLNLYRIGAENGDSQRSFMSTEANVIVPS